MHARVLEVLERVAESPTREAALVFADALLEAGDPYGEFIARSALGEVDAAAQLRRKHEKHWLGPLKPFLTSLEYRHGLLHAAAFSRKAPTEPEAVKAAVGHPLLWSLRSLFRDKSPTQRIHRADAAAYWAFIAADGTRHLEGIDGSEPGVLEQVIDAGGLGLTHCSTYGPTGPRSMCSRHRCSTAFALSNSRRRNTCFHRFW